MRLLEMLFMAQAWAASAEVEEHAASITQLLFPFLNFLLFLYLVKRFALPLVKDYLRSRREEILKAVAEADAGKRQAEEKIRDYRERLARLASEAKGIQETLRAEGERDRARLIAAAKEQAAKIQTDAAFLVEQEVKVARHQVRVEIARVAEEAAKGLLQRQLTEADQRRLAEEFLSELGGTR